MSILAEDISWTIGAKSILDAVSFQARPGEMLGLLGPNGSGKTSLLRLLAGLKQPRAGRVLLDGKDIRSIPRKAIARRLAFVEQHAATNQNLKVADVVKLGRFPHRSMFSGWTAADDAAVDRALARAGMAGTRDDRWQSLSGGERQRAHIARALAQDPSELILDEPTNHLDIQHQIGLLSLIADLPVTSIIALHDINHAAMFCDRLLVLKEGRIVAEGTPRDVLTEELLREVFKVKAQVDLPSADERPHVHFLRPAGNE